MDERLNEGWFINIEDKDLTQEWIKTQDLKIGDYVAYGFSNEVKEDENASIEFARLLGYYASDGCYHEDKKSICYLDKALTYRPIGKKLIYHEMGHAIYHQVFNDGLSPEESFLKSEEVATHIENTFPEFLEENLMVHHFVFGEDEKEDVKTMAFSAKDTIVKGLLWGLAFTTGAILMSSILDKKKTKKFFESSG